MTPDGGVASDQVAPSFWVTMTEATWPPSSPTATQVVELAVVFGADETAFTLARGLKLAVVCQVGVAAVAGRLETCIPRTQRATTAMVASAAEVILLIVSTPAPLGRSRAHE